MISSAVLGGGLTQGDWVINAEVAADYRRDDPAGHLEERRAHDRHRRPSDDLRYRRRRPLRRDGWTGVEGCGRQALTWSTIGDADGQTAAGWLMNQTSFSTRFLLFQPFGVRTKSWW
ncbi:MULTISPECIES: adenosylcobinamide amidohydrolase [unclassified Frankia]